MAFGETVVCRPGLTLDPRSGDYVQLPGNPHDLTGCVIAPAGAGETVEDSRDGDWDTVTVYVNDRPARAVKRTDVLEIRGEDYDITGLSIPWVDPEGDTSMGGYVIAATRAEG